MSDSESDRPDFVESEERATSLPYDKGGVPFYIAVAWVCILVAYVAIMATLSLPDLRKWLAL